MLSKIIIGIMIFIIPIILWEITPLKRCYFLLMGKSIGARTRMHIYLQLGSFRKFRQILKTAFDFTLFWMIFEWENGVIWEYIKEHWNYFTQWFQSSKDILIITLEKMNIFLISISPPGIYLASNPSVQYCLIISTICVVIAFIIYYAIFEEDVGISTNFILSFAGASCMWYACYGISTIVSNISICFHFLAALCMIATSVVLFFILAILLVLIKDFL